MSIPFRVYWRLLASYLRPQWPAAVLLAVLLFSSIALQLVNPQVVRFFIDTARAGGADSALLGAAILFISAALGQQLLGVAAVYVGENLGWRATNALRADLAQHLLRLDMSFHNARTPGELIERIDGDVTQMANFFSTLVIQIVGNALLLVGVLLVLFFEDWRVGLAMASLSAVALAVLSAVRDLATPQWIAARQGSAEQAGFVEERFLGTEDIRANGAVPYVMRQLFQVMRKIYLAYRRARLANHHTSVLTWSLFTLGTSLGLGIGIYLYQQGQASLGTVYMISAYGVMLAGPLQAITRQVQGLQEAGAGVRRVDELARQPVTVTDGPGAAFPPGPLSVEFDRVRFAYAADGSRVLHDVSFHLAPGRVLGLLGRTGSGKTSITRLIFRLYDPGAGAIRLGGCDIRQAQLDQLRDRVGLVTQDVQLFHATVRDNLTLFDPAITDDRIWAAIDDLGLRAWAESLPHGLDTELASGGQGLSAGEAQLLAFTRVLLKDPGLVILDEASSRLDPATERLIESAMDRLIYRPGRTAIIIAHRLGTVMRADEIMILEAGRVVEHGPRAPLAADPNSRFAALLQTGLEVSLG